MGIFLDVATTAMDPIANLFSQFGLGGAMLFVIWKIALKALGVWKENSAARLELEKAKIDFEKLRLTQQHEEYKKLSDAIECLSDRVHENTVAVQQAFSVTREFIENITPPMGMKATRHG